MNINFLFRILNKYDFFKQTRVYEFIRTIIFPLILKKISKFFKSKVDDRLIVMGGYGGGSYLGNTKYLFEFLNKHSDYNLVWITKSHDVVNEVRKKGYQAIYSYDLEAIRLLRKAKFIFITHGYVDVLPIEFSSDTKIIFTWHGTPIKIVNRNLENSYIYSKWAEFFHIKLKYEEFVDYMLTPTRDKQEHQILSKAFKISPKKILAVGYPKLDYLHDKSKDFISNLKKSYKIIESFDQVILFCPTYRESFILDFPFKSEQLRKLNNFLKKTNSLFLIKAHMLVKNINFRSYENIKVTSKEANIEELYLISDILITDYSSTMLDFSLLNRPILLYPYDLQEYLNEVGLYYKLEDIAPGPIFSNVDDLINGIKNISTIEKDFEEKRNLTRDKFNKFRDGKSTERLLNFLNIKFY
ncbi:MAG: CDP-glycerol glycerophosphotransferase family protein [Promethearchaeota archaeon]|jgi:CDP-glycerol glycerophosphotransferase (TagB/SpsB family)